MPKRQLETNVKETLQTIEETIFKLSVNLKQKKDIPLEDLTSITIKRYVISKKIDMPLSTWYSYQMNHRVSDHFDSIDYIKDAGKFDVNIPEFLEETEQLEQYYNEVEESE